MSLYNGPPRPGARGGRDQFNWEDVKGDKDREFYLGHSVKASVGRWQKGRDILWYTREKQEDGVLEDEVKAVKAREKELMLEALGLKPKSQPTVVPQLERQDMEQLLKKGLAVEEGAVPEEVAGMKGLGYALNAPRTSHVVQDKLEGAGLSLPLPPPPPAVSGRPPSQGRAPGPVVSEGLEDPIEVTLEEKRRRKKAKKEAKKAKKEKKRHKQRRHHSPSSTPSSEGGAGREPSGDEQDRRPGKWARIDDDGCIQARRNEGGHPLREGARVHARRVRGGLPDLDLYGSPQWREGDRYRGGGGRHEPDWVREGEYRRDPRGAQEGGHTLGDKGYRDHSRGESRGRSRYVEETRGDRQHRRYVEDTRRDRHRERCVEDTCDDRQRGNHDGECRNDEG